jgi:hypothetical protein
LQTDPPHGSVVICDRRILAVQRRRTASWPMALAMKVFPIPTGPTIITLRPPHSSMRPMSPSSKASAARAQAEPTRSGPHFLTTPTRA